MQIKMSITWIFILSPLVTFFVVSVIMFDFKTALSYWLISIVAEIVLAILIMILVWLLPKKWCYKIDKATSERLAQSVINKNLRKV